MTSSNPAPTKTITRWFNFGSIATVLTVLTGLYTLYSIDGQQRLFQARVGIELLSFDGNAGHAFVRIQNKSDRLLDGTVVKVLISDQQGNQSAGSLSTGATAPGDTSPVTLTLRPMPLKLGTQIELCVLSDGPVPMTSGVWKQRYQVDKFVPDPRGRPVCKHGMAEIMKHNVLPPEIAAEHRAGCVLPEIANPEIDYVPTKFTLSDLGKSQAWGLSILKSCGF